MCLHQGWEYVWAKLRCAFSAHGGVRGREEEREERGGASPILHRGGLLTRAPARFLRSLFNSTSAVITRFHWICSHECIASEWDILFFPSKFESYQGRPIWPKMLRYCLDFRSHWRTSWNPVSTGAAAVGCAPTVKKRGARGVMEPEVAGVQQDPFADPARLWQHRGPDNFLK